MTNLGQHKAAEQYETDLREFFTPRGLLDQGFP
jgi:hypothetical protein